MDQLFQQLDSCLLEIMSSSSISGAGIVMGQGGIPTGASMSMVHGSELDELLPFVVQLTNTAEVCAGSQNDCRRLDHSSNFCPFSEKRRFLN